MRARLTALNPAPVALPFDVEAGWQPRPFGYAASHLVDTDDPEQMRLSLVEVASGGVVTGPLATEPARLVMMDVDSTLTTTEAIDLLASHAGPAALSRPSPNAPCAVSSTSRARYGSEWPR